MSFPIARFCRGPDLKVKASKGGRYPDALIDRGPWTPGALQKPVAIFEVLSKSTAWIDQRLKLRDYDATPNIRPSQPGRDARTGLHAQPRRAT